MIRWATAGMTVAALVGGAIGAAFAPPANGQAVRRTTPKVVQLLGGNSGWIGVSIRDVEPDDAKDTVTGGVVVEEVSEDSPASKAGIKAGDVIVEFDGERIRSTRQFSRLVQETVPGRSVPAAVMRAGQRVSLTVQPSESGSMHYYGDWEGFKALRIPPAPPAPPAAPKPPAEPFEWFSRSEIFGGSGRLGITVSELSSQLAGYFGTKDGVLVTSVTDDSSAAKAGLRAGDVITSVNGGAVNSMAELRRRLQRLEDGDELTLEIVRDKKPMTLKGKIEDRQIRRSTRTIL